MVTFLLLGNRFLTLLQFFPSVLIMKEKKEVVSMTANEFFRVTGLHGSSCGSSDPVPACGSSDPAPSCGSSDPAEK